MENWKRVLLVGAASASAVMFLKRKPAAGIVLAGVGVAALAAEYPDEFADFREKLPGYVEQGMAFVDVISRLGQRLADAAAQPQEKWFEPFIAG